MKQTAFALLAAVLCSASSLVDATTYNITWSKNPKTTAFDAKAGDTLIFNFAAGAHNVWQFASEADLTKCDFTNGKLLSATAPYKFSVTATDPKLYFGCKVGDHCIAGNQKLTVNVGAGSTGGASPTTSTTPTTSSGNSGTPTTASSSASSMTVAWKVALESKTLTANPGDQITFQWTSGHDLHQFTSATEMQACNFQTATKLAATGPHVFTVPSSGASAYYFSCSVTGHCTKGQQLTVMVGGSSGNSSTGGGNSTSSDSSTGSNSSTPTTTSGAIRSADQVAFGGLAVALTAAIFQQVAL